MKKECGFHCFIIKKCLNSSLQVHTCKVEKKVNEIVNRLNKTKVEVVNPDLAGEREERDRKEREEAKKRMKAQKEKEKEELRLKQEQAEAR